MPVSVKETIQKNNVLSGQNANWRAYHQDLADMCLPRKAWITSPHIKGERIKMNYLYDSTAIRSAKIAAAGFQSNLTNQSTKWFGLRVADKDIMKIKAVQMWFSDVRDLILTVLSQSNFYQCISEFWLDYIVFGTANLMSLEDDKTLVRFSTLPIEQLNLEEDAEGRVNAVYRNFKLTASQAYRKWGANAGKTVVDFMAEDAAKGNEMLDFLWYVGPRMSYDPGLKDSRNMPFMSCWIAVKDEHLIEESGFEEFPHHVGRFYKDSYDAFGFGPAMDVLPDTHLISAQQRTVLRSSMKTADPAMIAPSKGFILPLNLNPAAMNYYDPSSSNADQLKPIVSGGNIPITLEIMDRVQKNIEQGFFVPLFQALSQVDKQMTVPEVQRRITENMVLLAPVVGRGTQEVLEPAIMRVFSILWRKKKLPPIPKEIQGMEMQTFYLSPLAKAQQESEITTVEAFLANVAQISAVKPDVLDKIDEDKTVDLFARIRGVSPEILRDEKDVEEIRAARAEQQAAQAKMDAVHQAAAIAKTGAEAAHSGAQAQAVGAGK